MNPARFTFFAIVLLALLLIAAGCSSSGSEDPRPAAFADDDDSLDDDDVADDDDATDDDDSTDDDTTDDDDSTDDDVVDDDDTTDDDDDSTSDPPTVTITDPSPSEHFNQTEIYVSALITDATSVTPYLDGVDVSTYLTVTETSVTGTLSGVGNGGHNFKVSATNANGTTNDDVNFIVEITDPTIDLSVPAGIVQTNVEIELPVVFFDETGADITDQVTINWSLNPNDNFTHNGNLFTFTAPDTWDITVSVLYDSNTYTDTETLEADDLIPATIIINAPAQAQAGDYVTFNYVVQNASGGILDPAYYSASISAQPTAGVTFHGTGNKIIRFTIATDYTVTISVSNKAGSKVTIQEEHDITILPGDPASVTLLVSDNTIDCYDTITYDASVVDNFGNPTDEALTMSTTPTDGVSINTGSKQITFNRAGNFTVKAQASGYGLATQPVAVDDRTDPEIYWDDPTCDTTERGTWTDATSFTLYGRVVENESDLNYFNINSQPVIYHPTTGCFTHQVMLNIGLNFFFAEAEDDFGNSSRANITVLRGQKLPHNTPVAHALEARINQGTFLAIQNLANDLLADLDLESLILGYTIPTVDLGVGTIDVEFTGANIGDPQISLYSTFGGVSLTGSVNPFSISISVDLSLSDKTIYTGTISATQIAISGELGIGLNAGQLELTLESFDVNLLNFDLDIPGMDQTYLNAIETMLIPMFETIVEDLVMDEVPPLLEDALAGLNLSFDFMVNDATISMAADFESVTFNNTGGSIIMAAGFTTDTDDPNTPQFDGSFYTQSTPPTLTTAIPGTSTPYGFGVSLADDLINQALDAVYRSGVITFHIDQAWADQQGFTYDLTTTDLALFFPRLYIQYPDTPVEFWLTPLLPPVMVFDPTKSLDVAFQMGDLTVDMMVVPSGQPPVKVLTMALALDIPVTMDVDTSANTLSLAFGTPTVAVDIYDELYPFFTDDLIEGFVPLLVTFIVPFVSDLLTEFPIPVLGGFTIQVNAMEIFGNAMDYMGIFGTLVPDAGVKFAP